MSGVDDKLVSQRLTTLIHRFLDAELLKSALFYAERLFSMDGTNHDSRHLLSNVLLKSDQPHSALHLVTRPQDEPCAGCLFLAAKCNERLLRPRKAKEKMTEALKVMTGIPEGSKPRPAQSMHLAHDIPDIAIVYCKAGMLAAKASQRQEAIDNFSHALALEPLIWDAWLGLCTLGADIKIDEVLKIPPHLQNVPATLPSDNEPTPPRPLTSNPILSRISKQYAIAPTPLTKPEAVGSSRGLFTPEQSGVDQLPYRYHLGNLPKPDTTTMGAPSVPQTPLGALPELYKSTSIPQSGIPIPQLGLPIHSSGQFAGTRRGATAVDEGPNKRIRTATGRSNKGKETATAQNLAPQSATRRSTRLLMSNGKQTQIKHPPLSKDNRRKARHRSRSVSDVEDTAGDAPSQSSGSIAQSPRSDSTENIPGGSIVPPETKQRTAIAERYVFDLMKHFARAQFHLSKYESRTALDCLERLPRNQYLAPSVLIMIARAHYELVEYVQSERAFKAARRLDPYRIWDMELYSTLLWHLRRNAQLSFLAQELLSTNPRSPEAWIAVGNCFSLQKEHAQAMVCFQRASELDPYCAYAYTLGGHESLVTDDVKKAIVLFEQALGHDRRHYNAWYGLGSCYLKMGRLALAQYHFERAVEIHPANAVLLACLGMVHERQGRVEEALSLFNVALEASPNNPLVRYRRAKIMVQRENFEAAEEDLVRLCDLSPSEPNVVLLLGKVYHLQGKTTEATRILATARDLDPRNAPRIAKLVDEAARSRNAAAAVGGPSLSSTGAGETSIDGPSESVVDVSMEG